MLFADIYYAEDDVRDPSESPLYECTEGYFSEHISTTKMGSSVAGILEHNSIFGDRRQGIDIFIIPHFKDIINESFEKEIPVVFYCTPQNESIKIKLEQKYGDKIEYCLSENKILPELKKVENMNKIGLFTTSLSYSYSMKNYIEQL